MSGTACSEQCSLARKLIQIKWSSSASCPKSWVRLQWSDKEASDHWWWSSHLASKAGWWKHSGSILSRRGRHSHHDACGPCCSTWPLSDSSSNRRHKRCCFGGDGNPHKTMSGCTIDSLWDGQGLLLHRCSWNSCLPWSTEGSPRLPCHDWMWHGISFHGTWKEICLGHMELVPSTDRLLSNPVYQACQHRGWHNVLQWNVCCSMPKSLIKEWLIR